MRSSNSFIRNLFFNDKYFDIVGWIIIFICIYLSIYMNFVNRSLWVDEAMLAYSLSSRSILNLTKNVFELNQTAPIIFLYLNKIIITIFGNTEFNLRILSIISYILVISITFLISKNIFCLKYPALSTAFVAKLPILIRYSNEFKQYIFETAITLIAFYSYYLYSKKYFTWQVELILCIIFILCANPVCFFIGGFLIYDVINSIYTKNKILLFQSIYIGVGISISFVIYYFYWLQPVATSEYMQNFWQNYTFPLIPKSLDELRIAKKLIEGQLMMQMQIYFKQIEILFIISLMIYIIIEKNKYCIVFTLSIFLALFASYIHMFPLQSRLWCFIFPFISILTFCGIDKLTQEITVFRIVAIALIFSLILNMGSITDIGGLKKWFDKNNIYMNRQEINFNISYLENNIKDGDQVLVLYTAMPGIKYKIGYNSNKIGDVNNDNIIWGTEQGNAKTDIKKITDADKLYIVSAHKFDEVYQLMEIMQNNGYVELIMNNYNTPLYFYTNNVKYIKQKVIYDIIDIKNNGNSCNIKIKITNNGSGYINGTKYDNIFLSSKDRPDIKIKFDDQVEPTKSVVFPLSFVWKEGENSVDLQLKNEGKFWFDELGCNPLHIVRSEH